MERSKKIIQISMVGIVINLLLVMLKSFTGVVTGSIAIIMDAVNNLSDVLSSVITIVGTKLAGKAPDKKHPYGYGQIEYVSSVTIAVIVLLAGLTSFKESLDKVFHPVSADYTTMSMILIAIAVVIKFVLGRYVKKQGEKYHSESLVASGTDGMLDSAISLSTLAAAVVSLLFHVSIEGWLGVIIAIIIFKAGIEILLESLSGIIGARVDSSLSISVKQHIAGYPQINGAYDLILHRYGPERIIGSVHVEVADDLTARELHGLFRSIMEDIYMNYGILLTIGLYASNTTDSLYAQMKEKLNGLTGDYPEVLQMHGFYVDSGKMEVSFDLIIDFKSKRKIQIRDEIIKNMSESYPQYRFHAVLDNDFSD
ncbi:MAG: cation diffusion facilitator family transporter [Ruminococcus sp.]|nr:cation diffusion facilitator family transporter [Ruminococcus sp.]